MEFLMYPTPSASIMAARCNDLKQLLLFFLAQVYIPGRATRAERHPNDNHGGGVREVCERCD